MDSSEGVAEGSGEVGTDGSLVVGDSDAEFVGWLVGSSLQAYRMLTKTSRYNSFSIGISRFWLPVQLNAKNWLPSIGGLDKSSAKLIPVCQTGLNEGSSSKGRVGLLFDLDDFYPALP
jgi:hypothetical protein